MAARLAASVVATALMRRAEAEGGFAAVLARGDPAAGAIVVILAEKGRKERIMERILQPDGRYAWQGMSPQALANEEELDKFLDRRRRFDPDMWVLELDIASVERFADAMTAFD